MECSGDMTGELDLSISISLRQVITLRLLDRSNGGTGERIVASQCAELNV
jgi:hypothetical protein